MNRWLFLLAVALAACFTTGSLAGEKLEKPRPRPDRSGGARTAMARSAVLE